MELETPKQLLRRLKLGREEYCQRLLTMLILDAPYPRWNSRSRPASGGRTFLRALYKQCFGSNGPSDDCFFVDEYELPARHPDEKGGAPDYAVLWADRLWVIELKTEKSSHRHAQIPTYFELARHHHPDASTDLLYVTPPMTTPTVTTEPWGRFAHTTWDAVAVHIRDAWPNPSNETHREIIDGLLAAIASLHLKPGVWRAGLKTETPIVTADTPVTPASEPPPLVVRPGLDLAMNAAQLTAEDGVQRGVDIVPQDLEELLELRLLTRNALAVTDEDSPLRNVVPWIWRHQSSGQPLTAAGRELGMELRLSRYRSPQS